MSIRSSTEQIREKKKLFFIREERIISAALDLFFSDGIDNVTVSKIATRAGIGKGTVYKHFVSKNEILVRIMLDYEKQLSLNLSEGIKRAEAGESGAAPKAYFQSRLARPELDRLVQQLEIRLADAVDISAQLEQLHSLRRSNEASLSEMLSRQIDRGVLENVPPHYHYLACWALAQGAVELCFNKSWNYRLDTEELMDFIAGIGITMGNRGQYRGKRAKKND